ncbi:MAG: DUF4007 family protein [Atopobiaceae bacterium]|nr:DUF4007 family protein [Atopobiaceae bacterium]
MEEKLKMKFKAHQTFAFRKGWLGKGLRAVSDNQAILMPSNSKNAMDELGLGANQVVSMRYWLEAAGLIRKRSKDHVIERLGQIILERDPYIEEIGTLWAIHCNIASAMTMASAWYFFFNEFHAAGAFDKDAFTHALERYIFLHNDKPKVALTSLESDFSCIINTYIPRERTSNKRHSPESIIDCPLSELGLMDVESRAAKTYRKKPANLGMLPSLLVLYPTCPTENQLKKTESNPEREIKLEALLNAAYGPGRIYNLDSVALLTKLYELESDEKLRINRTAGLDVVRLADPRMTKEDCLCEYYDWIG